MQRRNIDRLQRTLNVALIAVLLAACGDDEGPGPGGSEAGVDSGMMQMDSGTPPVGALGDNTAGKACSTNADCGAGMCAMQIAGAGIMSMSLTAPGGYCTAPCTTNEQCGAGGACLDDLADLDLADMQCFATCATTADCRDGYTCSAGFSLMGATLSTCRPAPDTDQLDDGVVGDECADAEDCPGGTCLTMTPGLLAGVGSIPLPGGYCSGNCTEAANCGAGGTCVLPVGRVRCRHLLPRLQHGRRLRARRLPLPSGPHRGPYLQPGGRSAARQHRGQGVQCGRRLRRQRGLLRHAASRRELRHVRGGAGRILFAGLHGGVGLRRRWRVRRRDLLPALRRPRRLPRWLRLRDARHHGHPGRRRLSWSARRARPAKSPTLARGRLRAPNRPRPRRPAAPRRTASAAGPPRSEPPRPPARACRRPGSASAAGGTPLRSDR